MTATAISFEFEPPSVAQIEDRIRCTLPRFPSALQRRGFSVTPMPVLTTSGPLADGRSTSLSMLMEGARKSGVRRSLCRAVLRTLQRQRFHAAFAGITLPNEGTVLSSDNPTVGAVSGLNRALRKH